MRRRKRGSGNALEALSTLVQKVYPADQPEEARAMRLFGSWSKVVPERIVKNARPVGFRGGVLTVHTATAAWANALSLESMQILQKLRARLPDVKVQRIAFRVGRLPELPEQVEPQKPPPRLVPLRDLPEDLARELARIHDDGLRDSVTRAAAMSLSEIAREPPGPRKR
jgi:hypothetical protein